VLNTERDSTLHYLIFQFVSPAEVQPN